MSQATECTPAELIQAIVSGEKGVFTTSPKLTDDAEGWALEAEKAFKLAQRYGCNPIIPHWSSDDSKGLMDCLLIGIEG